MRISVQVKPKKKKAFVERVDSHYYVVSVIEPPVDGRANTAVIKALAKFFAVSPSRITLVSGHTAKMKIFKIPDELKDFEVLPQQKIFLPKRPPQVFRQHLRDLRHCFYHRQI